MNSAVDCRVTVGAWSEQSGSPVDEQTFMQVRPTRGGGGGEGGWEGVSTSLCS